jgi:hypothetical protein
LRLLLSGLWTRDRPFQHGEFDALTRLDTFLTSTSGLRVRVACPSQEFSNEEMSEGVGRWFSCVRGMWESLSPAIEPGLVVIMLQAPPVDERILTYLLAAVRRSRSLPANFAARQALLSIPDFRNVHLSEKVLQAPGLLDAIRDTLTSAKRNGHSIEGLSCFASSDRMAQLATTLGLDLLETPPETLKWGTKEGSRAIFRAANVPHPAGTYTAERSLSQLSATLTGLDPGNGPAKWLLKLNDGYGSGHGNALLEYGRGSRPESASDFVARLHPVAPRVSREQFIQRLSAVGAIIEEFLSAPLAGEIRYPSALGHIGHVPHTVAILGAHDQVIGTEQDFIGCSFPADPHYRAEVLALTQRILLSLQRKGVRGHVGVDFIARANPERKNSWTVHATEINLRQTGSTHPNRTVRALVDAIWRPDGSLYGRAGEVCYTGTDGLISEQYRGISADRLITALSKSPTLGYDPQLTRGVMPHLWTTLEPFGKVGATFIGRSLADCAGLQDEFTALLESLGGERP